VAPSSMAANPIPPAAPEPGAAGGGLCGIDTRAGEGGHEVAESGVELFDVCCGGALLGAEHGCRAGEAEQRAGDVAGQDDLDATEVHSAAVIDAVSVAYRTVTGAEWSRS
jgi:hypothetical protein